MPKRIAPTSVLLVAGVIVPLGGGVLRAQVDPAHAGPVMNYYRVNDRLVTGGHLLDGGPAELKEQGVKVVIDLRDDSPSGEKQRFAEQGIEWINIPVEWRDPRKADFDRFAEVMQEHQDEHVLVQCAANYRAAAMTYLYRTVIEKVPEEDAAKDLRAVWNPSENDTWRAYLRDIKAAAEQD